MNVTAIALEGPTIRLEPLRREHLDGLCAVGLDPEIWHLTTALIRDRADLARYIETALAEQDAGHTLPLATILRATGQVVGSTRFANIAKEHRRVEIGWTWLGRQWQRTGVNTEAKYLMLHHAFETWNCLRVEFKTSALNNPSRTALRRLGATEEGVLRHHMINENGTVRDSVFYSILAEEWPSTKSRIHKLFADRGVSVER